MIATFLSSSPICSLPNSRSFFHLSPPAGRGRNRRAAEVSGEGDSPRAVETPPHPNPLPARGEREHTAIAALTQHRLPALDHGDVARLHLCLEGNDVAVLPHLHGHG